MADAAVVHAEAVAECELLVVDYRPDSPHGTLARDFVAGWVKRDVGAARYIAAPDVVGTAAPRDLVFREARGEAVLCLDCHVLVVPGAIRRLIDYYDAHPDTTDLPSGPLFYDDLQNVSTHFDDVWRAEMWGVWGTDPRGIDPAGEPFEIPAMGLGLFSCRKAAWPGFLRASVSSAARSFPFTKKSGSGAGPPSPRRERLRRRRGRLPRRRGAIVAFRRPSSHLPAA